VSGLGWRSDIGACVPIGNTKLCSLCEQEKKYKEVRYYYDTVADMYCYICDACVDGLIKKGLAEKND
jgi:hypothetical protein